MADDRPYELMQDGEATGVVELPPTRPALALDDWQPNPLSY